MSLAIESIDSDDETFWHLTDSKIMLNNAYIGKGFVLSASWTADILKNSGFVSPYQALHLDKDKEQIWEDVRRDHFPNLPSRMGAVFLFECRQDMDRARSDWGLGKRIPIRVKVVSDAGSKILVADSRWLHTPAGVWKESAHRYWSGLMSEDPLREIIVHGRIFCPDWQEAPFGSLTAPNA